MDKFEKFMLTLMLLVLGSLIVAVHRDLTIRIERSTEKLDNHILETKTELSNLIVSH